MVYGGGYGGYGRGYGRGQGRGVGRGYDLYVSGYGRVYGGYGNYGHGYGGRHNDRENAGGRGGYGVLPPPPIECKPPCYRTYGVPGREKCVCLGTLIVHTAPAVIETEAKWTLIHGTRTDHV